MPPFHNAAQRPRYSVVASKLGQAFAAKSRWPWMLAGAVCSRRSFGAPCMNRPVAVYHPVITYSAESAGTVPPVDVGYGEVAPFRRGATVDYDFLDFHK